MKRMKIFTWAILVVAGLTACTDWLTVQPKTEVSKDDMFKSSGGFRDALIGVYTLMRDYNYAPNGNLVTGMVEYIANLWYAKSNTEMGDFVQHNYRGDAVEAASGELFLQQYRAITNLNLMLSYVDNGVLSSKEYALYKGEALGLRAYLHFDLIRLYGPMPANVPEGRSYLPYVTTVSLENYTYSTYNEYMKTLIADLDSAEVLLARVDPIITTANSALNSPPLNEYRQNRMNYYAVLAQKARVHLWMGNKEEALRCARLVKNAAIEGITPQFALGPMSPLGPIGGSGGNDFVFFNEQIFAVYVEDFSDVQMASSSNSYLNQYSYLIEGLYPEVNGAADIRLYLWYSSTYNASSSMYKRSTRKYAGLDAAETTNVSPSRGVPLIRLAEMYLIIAECAPLDEANTVYGELLKSRNVLATALTEENREEVLMTEYLKEFYAEGQTFYAYKRYAVEQMRWSDLTCGESDYVVPLPRREISTEDIY